MGTAWDVITAIASPQISVEPQFRQRIRTVVVDDSPAYLEVICELLKMEDLVEVIGRATNGADAIAAVANLRPDLLLMDIQMPGMNGFLAAAFLSVEFPKTKIVLMSSQDPTVVRHGWEVCGAHAFINTADLRHKFATTLRKLFPAVENSSQNDNAAGTH